MLARVGFQGLAAAGQQASGLAVVSHEPSAALGYRSSDVAGSAHEGFPIHRDAGVFQKLIPC